MPLQTSGQISLSQIQTQYGGANNLSISEYYNGGPNTTPNVSTSRISKIRMIGVSGTTDENADIREFEFDGLGDWGTGDRRTGNNEIVISTNMNTISDPNSNTEPHLNAWINGSKELDTPDSRYLVGQVTINSDYYIEFEFVGSATKPLVNDFNKLKIYWDKSDISQDADMGTWEIMVYNEDGMELSYGNITLTESNIVSTGSSNSQVWQYFTSTYISGGEALRSTEYFSPQDIDQNPTKLAEKTSNSINNGYLGFLWANPAPNHGVPAGAVSFDFVRTNESNTITLTYNRQGSMNNYDGNKRHMLVHIANATAAGVYQTKSYATFKNANGTDYTSSGGSNEPVITPSVSINDLGNNYKYVVFQNTGANQTSYNITFTESTSCDILIVGGGGSGGVRDAGAGGAGGLIYLTNVNILNSNLSVGKGGASRTSGSHISGYKGNNSFIVINSITYTAEGGGKGGQWNGSNNNSTGSGGSGGGGGGNNSAGGTGNQPSSTSGGYGNNGAQGSGSYSGGGGGGAGGAGTRHSGDTGGNGGIGMDFSAIFGTDYGENGWFAGGGGMGSGTGANGTGGQGGGGNGGNSGAAEGGMDGTGGGGGGHRNSGGISGKGGDGIIIIRYLNNTTSHYLEFNLGTPSAIASGGYVSGVSYIPTYSQPYTEIKFSDFYYQEPVSSGPPNPPNESPNRGVSGGLGNNTGYEIITGLYANNTSRTEGTTSFDNRGATGRNSSNNVAYMNLIIQAKPGDVLNLIGRINTNGSWLEFCEFWVWLGSWSRFTAPSATFSGNKDFSVNYTIPLNTDAGNYALAVACSYGSLGSSSFRSWKSYSLEVWT